LLVAAVEVAVVAGVTLATSMAEAEVVVVLLTVGAVLREQEAVREQEEQTQEPQAL
jgi:hypothetical protein